jgi:heme-degrading monooxygenase HmoA
VHNLEEPTEVISITVWDTAEEGKTFYGSEVYKRIFGGIAHLIEAAPQYKSFEVLVEWMQETEPA